MHPTISTFRWIVVVCLGNVLGVCACGSPAPASYPNTVVEVIDGDTIIVNFGQSNVESVRLLGVDTPETVDPSRPEQCFGTEASTYLASLLPPGTEVDLERDVEARDHFGRLLGYVFRSEDQLFVNRELLLHGFADLSIYEPNSTYEPTLSAALTSARTQSAGLWEACGGPDVAIDPPPLEVG